jgi:hypothetical protein
MEEMKLNVFQKMDAHKKIEYNGGTKGIDYSKNPMSEKAPKMRVFDIDMD